MFNIANLLSLSRVILAPIFIFVFFMEGSGAALLAFLIALTIEMTDLFDGRLARKLNIVSDFGKLFDPIADRISRFTIFMTFLAGGLAPLWMIFVLYLRDELVSLLRMLAANRNIVVAARQSGKTKAITQGIAICVTLFVRYILLATGVDEPTFSYWLLGFSYTLMFATTAVTLVSLFDYLMAGKDVLASYR